MRKIFALGLFVALVVGVGVLPAEAKGRHGGGFSHGARGHGGGHAHGHFRGGHGHGGHRHGHGHFHGGHRHGHGHFHGGHGHGRAFVGFGFWGGWPYWGYPYPYYGYGYPYYYPPAVVYTAPSTVYSAPSYTNGYTNGYTQRSAPAIQREVVYPHGKYVLEGDGVSTPYKWVWIANSEYQPAEPPRSDTPGAAPPGPPPSR
jgi:hypothetical protein